MKVVIFCNDAEMGFSGGVAEIPKSLEPIGYRPIIWHVMKYYAHFGHKDFILSLGHNGSAIKDYFVNYSEYVSNDFYLKGYTTNVFNRDIQDWNIVFAETGSKANTAERLISIKKYLDRDEMFLATYSDCLTDVNLSLMTEQFETMESTAMILAAKPRMNLQLASINDDNEVTSMEMLKNVNSVWINTGCYIFKRDIFDFVDTRDDLPLLTFNRLIQLGRLASFPYDGFFITMNTYREKEELDRMHEMDITPWQVWKNDDRKAIWSSQGAV